MPIRLSAAAGLLGALSFATLACATAPTRQLTESKSAFRAASEIGAQEHPAAAYHLQLAREQITAAERLMHDDGADDEEMLAARHYLERAEVDAELAIVYARTESVKQAAQRAWDQVEELSSEAD